MTEAHAIALAQRFVSTNGLPAEAFLDARHMKAERFNELYGYDRYKYDFWVVQFVRRLEPGVVIQNPSTVAIVVEENTERAFEAFPGWE